MSSPTLDVTACVLSLNRPLYLCDAISSILAQTKLPNDIVIYDNGSQPDVFAATEDYFSMGVRWRGSDLTRSGFWNFRRAVAEAQSEYVLIMHDDDRLCVDFIEKQMNFLEKNKDVVVVSCNGYWLDEYGIQIGKKLFSDLSDEMYRCSGDVAMRYASDRCIPFSPAVYRTKVLCQIDISEEYDKGSDAVLFCDLADVGIVAYQSSPLYECRIHGGQDSNYFAPEVMDRLERFFWTRKTKNNEDKIRLHKLLVVQHTRHNLLRLLKSLGRGYSIRATLGELSKFWDGIFSPLAAVKIIAKAVMKRIISIVK